MVYQPSESKMAKEVEHSVVRTANLKVLGGAAAGFLTGLFRAQLSPAELSVVIESEPALAFMLYRLAGKKGKAGGNTNLSIPAVLNSLDLRDIRDAFFGLELYQSADGSERAELRKGLIINSVATASIARQLSQRSAMDCDSDLAYAAGLLYNIGNLALDEVMPRSFSAMVSRCRTEKLCICDVQQENLNTNYTILGKRLAVKAQLPEPIQLAIWLHQSGIEEVIDTMPEAKIALIVRAAYQLAGKYNIGISGSFNDFQLSGAMVDVIGLERAELEDIAVEVSQQVERNRLYTKSSEQGISDYCKAIQFASAELAAEGSTYFKKAQRAQTKASHYDFTAELLNGIAAEAEPIEIAEQFACQWQKFYQTGNVCLYLTENESDGIEVVTVSGQGRAIKYLKPPAGNLPVPEWIQREFRVIDTDIDFDWLFGQLDIEFEKSKTKAAPLIFKGRAIGAIVFEFHYPVGAASLKEMFSSTCGIAASIIEAAFARSRQQRFAESFARLRMPAGAVKTEKEAEPCQQRQMKDEGANIDVLAEMAAGAAHELNNPLSVISGRAELLAQGEDEPQKKQDLLQIQQNCRELSGIVEDLMAYAQPAAARKSLVSTNQIIDEAMELTGLKTGQENIDFNVDVADDTNDVFVDSGQVVSSLANILSNAVESYPGLQGAVGIIAKRRDNFVEITVSDSGCGMDEETVKKATHPFFSSKPAGRKRGMGLAYAKRLIELNGGKLSIQSQPDNGTTVTITLPLN